MKAPMEQPRSRRPARADQELVAVKAPSDGIFYRRPSPDSPAYVQVGDTVQFNSKAFKHYVRTPSGGYNLRSPLGNDKLPLFPCEHLHYEPRPALTNAGPSVLEIVDATGRARRLVDGDVRP